MAPIIPRISLHDFANRKQEITLQLMSAASTYGFFILQNQPFPSADAILNQFHRSEAFFTQSSELKNKTPFSRVDNMGYEFYEQVRPSTGSPDQKESLQIQFHNKNRWPVVSLPENDGGQEAGSLWKDESWDFMQQCHNLSMMVLECFEKKLGIREGFFKKAHDQSSQTAQTTMRLIHYPPMKPNTPSDYFRAGAHTDFDFLTLLFQKSGEQGLEVCSQVRETHTSLHVGEEWISVPAVTGEIVVNIGDMLMSLSDDRFKSNYHRVRLPQESERSRSRYSIAFFNQANKEVVIQGPQKKYPPLTAEQYIKQAIERNYGGAKKSSNSQ